MGFVVDRVGFLSGMEVECWGEVLTDDRDPRALGADSLTNNSGELWALAEAFLWLRDDSGDDKSVSVTLIYDSEVAKDLVTEPWAPQSHLRLVSLLRDLYVEACDSRVVSWVGRPIPQSNIFSPLMKGPIASLNEVVLGNLVLFCRDGFTLSG